MIVSHSSPDMDKERQKLSITRLGSNGDGVDYVEGQVVFVPYTCPGDQVVVDLTPAGKKAYRGKVIEFLKQSDKRQVPPCTHFGVCGGCALQHLVPDSYQQFKRDRCQTIISRLHGDMSDILPMVTTTIGQRRRVEFQVAVRKGDVRIGFHAHRSHDVVPVSMCPISDNKIVALLPSLQEMLEQCKKASLVCSIQITVVERQIDIMVVVKKPLPERDMKLLKAYVDHHDNVTRLALSKEKEYYPLAVYGQRELEITSGNAKVSLPPGAFLQATDSSHQHMVEYVVSHIKGCQKVADIYAGCGTYSFPLAAVGHRVSAFEGSDEMVMAIQNAAKRYVKEGQVSATTRDLVKSPLSDKELSHFDAVVINPPRNGAEPQVKMIAKSGVSTVIMVSCNPATFERDARHLLAAGYHMSDVLPVDQFYWSPHLEMLAVFQQRP